MYIMKRFFIDNDIAKGLEDTGWIGFWFSPPSSKQVYPEGFGLGD